MRQPLTCGLLLCTHTTFSSIVLLVRGPVAVLMLHMSASITGRSPTTRGSEEWRSAQITAFE
ncbi:hypothetical protein ACSS6W_007671 [Trichoderma asperelloides]